MSDVRAMVLTGPNQIEERRFPRPETDEDSALLRIEASGICGTDYESLSGEYAREYPLILGHEPLGVIEEIGDRAAARWGVEAGDRVVVQPNHGCGACRRCNDGARCNFVDGGYGSTPAAVAPALWGRVRRAHVPGARLEATPGAGRVAAPPRGAGEPDRRRLRLGRPRRRAAGRRPHRHPRRGPARGSPRPSPPATPGPTSSPSRASRATSTSSRSPASSARTRTIDVDAEDPVSAVLERTDGEGVDVVVDLTPYSTEPVVQGIEMLRPGGTMVLAGLKGTHRVAEFDSDAIIRQEANVRGVRGVDRESFVRALRLIASGRYPVERMHTHEFPLEDVERGIRTLSGETGEPAISITVEP